MKKDNIALELMIAEIYELAKSIKNPAEIVFVPKIPESQRGHYKRLPDGSYKTNYRYY